ncbi:MAG: Gfo/Idh/MocA family oxidoreductase [Salibacteraceae bacterium]
MFTGEPASDRKVRIGIVGGGFGTSFYFHEHPNCVVEAVSDLRADRRERLMRVYECEKSYESLEKLLHDTKIEAVFLATPVPDHAAHVLASLEAGKHVLCTVAAASSLEECAQLKEAVERTGLNYMMAETSTYRQITISAKKLYREGRFGRIFAAEAEYDHPGISNIWFDSKGKPTWRQGQPPMHYPTHATAFLIAVTGERLTHVSCLGWGDDSPLLKPNAYKNPFWNQTALFQTNKETAFRARIYRKGAFGGAERAKWYGDKMSLHAEHPNGLGPTIVRASEELTEDEGGFKVGEPVIDAYDQPLWWKTHLLPDTLQHESGHGGSHTFITHEFIDSIIQERPPEVDIYEALAYTAPGLVAHQSSLKGGERLKIPSFDPS